MKYKNQIQHIEKLRKLPKHSQQNNQNNNKSKAQQAFNTEVTDAANLAAAEAADKFDKLAGDIKEATKSGKGFVDLINTMVSPGGLPTLQSGLAGVIALQQKMSKITRQLTKNATQLEEKFKSTFKTYKVGAVNANKIVAGQLNIAGALGTTQKQADLYTQTLTKLLPLQGKNLLEQANVQKNEKGVLEIKNKALEADYKTLDALQKQLGLSQEAAAGYISFAAVQGKSSQEVLATGQKLAAFLEDKGLVGALPEITQEIGSLGSDLRLQYGRLGGNLEIAVLKARQLGISVKDLAKTGENFLNIEESVGKELEYQLLTGKRLLTQDGKSLTAEYRKATMMGKSNEQAELMKKLLQDHGKELQTSLFARKQMADLLGMNEAQLGAMVEKQRLMSKYGIGEEAFELDSDKLQEKLEEAGLEGKDLKEAIDKLDQRTTEDIANEYLSNIQENTLRLSKAFMAGNVIAGTRKTLLEDDDSFIKQTGKLVNALSAVAEDEKTIKDLGFISNLSTSTAQLANYAKQLSNFIPFLGDSLGKFTGTVEKYSKLVQTTLTMDQEAVNTTDTSGQQKHADMIWRPGAPPQRFSSGDLAFLVDGNAARPAGAGAAAAGAGLGGGGSIDYNKLAAAMANVQITIDPLYSSTTMNNGTFTA